jgi:hypothetical protein
MPSSRGSGQEGRSAGIPPALLLPEGPDRQTFHGRVAF